MLHKDIMLFHRDMYDVAYTYTVEVCIGNSGFLFPMKSRGNRHSVIRERELK